MAGERQHSARLEQRRWVVNALPLRCCRG
jgi:hypothetical protein